MVGFFYIIVFSSKGEEENALYTAPAWHYLVAGFSAVGVLEGVAGVLNGGAAA